MLLPKSYAGSLQVALSTQTTTHTAQQPLNGLRTALKKISRSVNAAFSAVPVAKFEQQTAAAAVSATTVLEGLPCEFCVSFTATKERRTSFHNVLNVRFIAKNPLMGLTDRAGEKARALMGQFKGLPPPPIDLSQRSVMG